MKEKDQLGFIHRFLASEHNKRDRSLTLLLLHGTGGDENDLIQIARMMDPVGASILSPRGKVLENDLPRFFRRLSEGVFDIKDLKFRTHELADFIQNASKLYKFDLEHLVAVGYSNGANIAASMLLLRPEILAGSILFRAMIPFVLDSVPNLSGKYIFMSAGLHDPIVPSRGTKGLFDLLKKTGSNVSLKWQNSGHELTQRDVIEAREWLSASFTT
ncbi:MAG: alpha/beta hydrolase [Nitrososphaeraceae archaeon]